MRVSRHYKQIRFNCFLKLWMLLVSRSDGAGRLFQATCAKFGDFSFSRFGFYRADRQTDTHRERERERERERITHRRHADDCYTDATIWSASDSISKYRSRNVEAEFSSMTQFCIYLISVLTLFRLQYGASVCFSFCLLLLITACTVVQAVI